MGDYSKAIELKPDLAEAYVNRGDTKLVADDWDGAIADCSKAIELKPDDVAAYNNRSLAKKDKGDLDGAIADASKAIEIKPDYATAYDTRGFAKNARGDVAGALADYNKAIELKPDLAEAYNNRSLAKKDKGDLDGAIADASKAIEIRPGFATAYNNRGFAKNAKGDREGAMMDYNKAIELKPDSAAAYDNRGTIKVFHGDLDGALADFTRAIELKPNDGMAYNNRGWARFVNNDFSGAVADCKKAVAMTGANSLASVESQAVIDYVNGEYSKAAAACWKRRFNWSRRRNQFCSRGLKGRRGRLKAIDADVTHENKIRKHALLALLITILVPISLWIWAGMRLGIWTFREYERYIELTEQLPVARELWWGDIKAGDDVKNLINDQRPHMISQFGPWMELRWFPGGPSDDYISFIGMCVVAKNGVVISASSYTDDGIDNRVFFNTARPSDETNFLAAYKAYAERLGAENVLLTTDLPILQQLWQEKIKAGDDIEKIIKRWPPRVITRFGPWLVLRWFPENPSPGAIHLIGARMIAKNGALVYANTFSDDGHHATYINTETPSDEADFDAAYKKYCDNFESRSVRNQPLRVRI